MRFGRRTAVVIAVAAASALAVVGVAMAATRSTAVFNFSPDKVPKKTYKPGKLFVHTHTNYSSTSSKTQRAQLYFDDDFKIRTRGIPQCNKSKISGTVTMQAAMAACGRAKVGSGKAQAAAGSNTVNACVLAFNGKPSNGKPTLLLFTRANVAPPFTINCSSPSTNTQGNTNVLLVGLYKGATGDFGTQLDIDHIDSASALPLTDFRTTIKRGRYVSARCHDKNRTWNMKTKFTYLSPSGTQTVNSSETCRVQRKRR
ncbi:MAG: hypothetical protein ACRDK1_11055 [Solirubrobacterales bacterium]